MNNDHTLTGLIYQIHLAREIYHVRKGQESLPQGRSMEAQRALTNDAHVAWQAAENALWQFKASPARDG
jgi:hypothetical protein